MATPDQTSGKEQDAKPADKTDPNKPRDAQQPPSSDRKPRGGGQIDTSDKEGGVR